MRYPDADKFVALIEEQNKVPQFGCFYSDENCYHFAIFIEGLMNHIICMQNSKS